MRVVIEVVCCKGGTNTVGAHFKDWVFGTTSVSVNAWFHMNLAVDVVCLRVHWREKVGHWVLFNIPISGKYAIVIREYAAGNLRDIVDDFATFIGGTCPVSAKHLLAILLKDSDLWHVGVVYDV